MVVRIGARISLITDSDLRYEGILHSLSAEEGTICLSEVYCAGTEDRQKVVQPPQSRPFSYITFKGTNIKDVEVLDEQPSPDKGGGAKAGGKGGKDSMSQAGGANANQWGRKDRQQQQMPHQQHQQQHQQHQQVQQQPKGFGKGVQQDYGKGGKSMGKGMGYGKAESGYGKGQYGKGYGGYDDYGYGHDSYNHSYGHDYYGMGMDYGKGYGGYSQKGKGKGYGKASYQPMYSQSHYGGKGVVRDVRPGGKNAGKGKGRRMDSGPVGELKGSTDEALKEQYSEEFDFGKSTEEVLKQGEAQADASVTEAKETKTGYDKTKSFFDSISCEASQKARAEQQRPDRSKLKEQDMETFGTSALHPPFGKRSYRRPPGVSGRRAFGTSFTDGR